AEKAKLQGIKSALETLAKSPDDPGANNELGKHLCLVTGSWDLGLRYLAKGSDPILKDLAARELTLAQQPAEQVAVADGWYDLSEKEKSPERKAVLAAHSRGFYELALPKASGLLKVKVNKRLTPLGQSGVSGAAIDLLSLIDLKQDVYSGSWNMVAGKLVTPAGAASPQLTHVRLPYIP